MRLILISACTSIFLLMSCSKYEENEGISLRPKKMRMVGNWLYNSYTDANGNVFSLNAKQTAEGSMSLKKDHSGFLGEDEITWYFSDDKTALIYSINTNPSFFYKEPILYLTNLQLWLGTKETGYKAFEKVTSEE